VDFEDRKREEEQLSSQESSKQVEENLEFADRILDIDKLEHGPVLQNSVKFLMKKTSSFYREAPEVVLCNFRTTTSI